MTKSKSQTSVTGRDGYIVTKALIYAIAHIQSLPEERQEFSDMLDMCSIALASSGAIFLPAHVSTVLNHTGVRVNLWPSGGWLNYEHPELTEDDLAMKEAIAQHIDFLAQAWANYDKQNEEAVA